MTQARWNLKQLSLRTVLCLVAAACVGLAIWTQRAKTQERVTTAVLAAGGRVTYSKQASRWCTPPTWLVSAFGSDYFFAVEGITFYPESTESADELVKLLDGFEIKRLAIWPGCKGRPNSPGDHTPGGLTDGGAQYLRKHHPTLRHLSLLSAQLSKDECRELEKAIPSLQLGLHENFKPVRSQPLPDFVGALEIEIPAAPEN